MSKVEILKRDKVIGVEYSEDAKIFSIAKVMQKAFGLLVNELKRQKCGQENTTLVYTRYRDIDFKKMAQMNFFQKLVGMFDTFKMDMGISSKTFDPNNSAFKTGEIPAGEYVQYLHVGAYKKMHSAYDTLAKYILDNDLEVENVSYDLYLNNPEEVSEDKLETIIMVQLKS